MCAERQSRPRRFPGVQPGTSKSRELRPSAQKELAAREGTSGPFPRLCSHPCNPQRWRDLQELSRTSKNSLRVLFLSLLLPRAGASVVLVRFPHCSPGFALFSRSCFR